MKTSGENHSLLDIFKVSKRFGGLQALYEVTFGLDKGRIISLIGPNGAGKTTLINVISGIYAPWSGQVLFQGKDITSLPAHAIAGLGIGRTFQFVEPFSSLTVLENTMVGCHTRSLAGMLSVGFSLPSARAEERRIREQAIESLKMVGLEHRASSDISNLPLGEQKLVGIARALSMNPKLLMLDEPAGGLAAHEVSKIVELIHQLSERDITILFVEHNMPFVMSISERVVVLDQGRKIAEGAPEEVKANEAVIKAYLGEEA
jgi:branched-chain amino acid transport system ATP-binding protein